MIYTYVYLYLSSAVSLEASTGSLLEHLSALLGRAACRVSFSSFSVPELCVAHQDPFSSRCPLCSFILRSLQPAFRSFPQGTVRRIHLPSSDLALASLLPLCRFGQGSAPLHSCQTLRNHRCSTRLNSDLTLGDTQGERRI